MNRTIAIAALAVRAVFRSRLFITLMIVLLFVIVGLPLTIRGDGTVAGKIKILLYYTLGLATIVQGTATLWTSCAAISREIEEKQIQLTVTKPVHRFQVWLGKWLGLLFINAVLLALTGISVYLCIRYDVNSSRLGENERQTLGRELLVGRMLIVPDRESVDAEAHKKLEQLAREGNIAKDMTEDEAFAQIKKSMLAERSVVSPEQSRQWSFTVPGASSVLDAKRTGSADAEDEDSVAIRFRFTSTIYERRPVSGTWIIAGKNGVETHRCEIKDFLAGAHTVFAPKSAVPTGPVTLTFKNADRSRSNAALFDSDTPVQLLVRWSSFESNLIRGLAVILCQLGLIAAIGLTAGSLFSFPVASFSAVAVLCIAVAGNYFATASLPRYACEHHHHHGVETEDSAIQTVGAAALKKLDIVIAPAMNISPLEHLSDGILVSWGLAGKAALILLVLYPGCLALLGGYCLNRRELALPMG